MNKIIAIFIVIISMVGCSLITGERLLVIGGELEEGLGRCTLDILSKRDELKIYTLSIEGGFKIDRTVEAKNILYNTNITCLGVVMATKEFKSTSSVTQIEFGNVSTK